MPYSRSAARAAAFARIGDLRTPFTYAKVRPKALPAHVREAIFQACVFQLSAILEDYVGAVVRAWLDGLSGGAAQNRLIPRSARAFVAAKAQQEAFLRYLAFGDDGDLISRTDSAGEFLQLLNDGANLAGQDVSGVVLTKRKFPKPENLDGLFKRLGFERMVNALSIRTRTNVLLSMKSFIDVRNALAHESPPDITHADVERYFSQVSTWIAALDREIYGHVVRVSGSTYWK